MRSRIDELIAGHVISADGTPIEYLTIGSGPGLVIVHGVGRVARNYRDLAVALADSYTVHLMNRRGRGESGEQGREYAIGKECRDAEALLRHTGAEYLFGHSYGGLVGLETALDVPLRKLALYEPVLSIDGSMPVAWLPAFERAVRRESYADAMAILIKGPDLAGPLSRLPLWTIRGIVRLLSMRGGEEWEDTKRVLPTIPSEVREVIRLDGAAGAYAAIECPTLLMVGGKSPSYLRDVARTLAGIIPDARYLGLPEFGHNAPDLQSPERIAGELKRFFGDRNPTASS